MPQPTLEDLDDRLDAGTVGALGDSIIYTPAVGAPVPLKAFIDEAEAVRDFGQSASLADDLEIELRVVDVPVTPSKACRIQVVKTGKVFVPIAWPRDASGRWWRIRASKVPA